MIKRLMKMATLLALGLASPALAQGTEFRIGSVRYTVPAPKGYCLPERPTDVERMHFAASLDKVNATALSLVTCDPNGDRTDYILIKAQISMIGTPMTLKQLQELAGPEFDKEADIALPGVEQQLGDAFSQRGGKPVDIKTAIGPRGRDDRCLYIGGSAVSEGLTGGAMSVGGCITVVGQQTVAVFVYGPGDDPATVRSLMGRARAFAETIRVKPGQ